MDKLLKGIASLPVLKLWPAVLLVVLGIVATLLTQRLQPTRYVERQGATLGAMLPPAVPGWQERKSNMVQMSLTPDGVDRSQAVAATYDDTAMTSYSDDQGHVVMVALAYGRSQRQEGKIHRPELCYSAQGFTVKSSASVALPLAADAASVRIQRLDTQGRNHREIVSYWIRIGDLFSTSAFETRTHIMKVGLQGDIPDGILFRVSQVVPKDLSASELEAAFARQESFMAALSKSLTGGSKKMLLGDQLAARVGGPHEAS